MLRISTIVASVVTLMSMPVSCLADSLASSASGTVSDGLPHSINSRTSSPYIVPTDPGVSTSWQGNGGIGRAYSQPAGYWQSRREMSTSANRDSHVQQFNWPSSQQWRYYNDQTVKQTSAVATTKKVAQKQTTRAKVH